MEIRKLINRIRRRNTFVSVSDAESYNELLARYNFLKEAEYSASLSFFKHEVYNLI